MYTISIYVYWRARKCNSGWKPSNNVGFHSIKVMSNVCPGLIPCFYLIPGNHGREPSFSSSCPWNSGWYNDLAQYNDQGVVNHCHPMSDNPRICSRSSHMPWMRWLVSRMSLRILGEKWGVRAYCFYERFICPLKMRRFIPEAHLRIFSGRLGDLQYTTGGPGFFWNGILDGNNLRP